MAKPELVELLRQLARHDIEAIVVSLLAGVMQGAPLATGDIDIVHRRSPGNIACLLSALRQLGATARNDPQLSSLESTLSSNAGHVSFESSLGDVDCLCAIDDGKGYDELVASTVRLDVGEGLSVLALRLDTLIEIKRRAGRPKDIAALPVLESTWEQIMRQSEGCPP